MIEKVGYNKNNYGYYNYPNITMPNFRGVEKPTQIQNIPQQYTTIPDSVKISAENQIKNKKEKKGLSTAQKWALGIGTGIAALAGTTILFARHQTGKLTKLYNEKMQLVNLAEKIDFKEAKTLEEGIKFAKETLKIGEVGDGFTLDAINYVNKGLVDVSNANKGHLFMPKKIIFEELNENELAHVVRSIDSERFGELAVNKRFFDSKLLDERLKKDLYNEAGKKRYNIQGDGEIICPLIRSFALVPDKKVLQLIKEFYSNSEKMDINKKRELWSSIYKNYDDLQGKLERCSLDTIKKYKEKFEKNLGIKIDIDTVSKKSIKEQSELLSDYFNKLKEKKVYLKNEIKDISPLETVYHEMGHLQDFAKNLKELDLKHWKLPSFKEAYKEVKAGKKHVNTAEIEHVDNRWQGLTYEGFKDLFEKNPEKFKKKYPDLYEFLTNQEIQQSAGKVSWYAQTSIGEFIAEVYAKMIRGEKIPDDVMALYKKYNGPTIPFT